MEMMGRYSNPPDQPRIPNLENVAAMEGSDGSPRRRRTGPKLSTEDLDGIRAEYEAGTTIKEICANYGVTRNTVRIRARRMGLAPRGPRGSAS